MFISEVSFVEKCREIVANYTNKHLDQSDINNGIVN